MLSRRHPLVKKLRELRDDPRARESGGVFIAEGLHLAEEALRTGAAIELAVVSPRLADAGLREALRRAAAAFEEAPDDLLDAIQDARSPQPVLLLLKRPAPPPRPGVPLVVIACGIQDPGNLGTLLRSADAAGATAFVASGGADLFHPRTVRATMGALFRLPCSRAPFDDAAAALRSAGVTLVGADAGGGTEHTAFDWSHPTAIVLGGEGAGLGPSERSRLDATVRIPMHGPSESLSVAAAGAVLLFEAARQRRLSSGG